jgi:hypothetical protein
VFCSSSCCGSGCAGRQTRSRELYETALDGFEDWADEYGLPTTPHVFAAYLVELHSDGVEIDDLKFISEAYLNQHDRDVHVPIRAALQYCCSR